MVLWQQTWLNSLSSVIFPILYIVQLNDGGKMYIVHVCRLLAAPPVSTKHELVLGGGPGALYQVSHHPRQPQGNFLTVSSSSSSLLPSSMSPKIVHFLAISYHLQWQYKDLKTITQQWRRWWWWLLTRKSEVKLHDLEAPPTLSLYSIPHCSLRNTRFTLLKFFYPHICETLSYSSIRRIHSSEWVTNVQSNLWDTSQYVIHFIMHPR